MAAKVRRLRFGASRRTPLALSPEVQTLMNLMASFGHGACEAAVALKTARWDFGKAAMLLDITPEALRMRVHRLQERARAMLGDAFHVPVRREAAVWYGADRPAFEEGMSLYEKVGTMDPEPVG